MSGVKTQAIISSNSFFRPRLKGSWGLIGISAILYTLINIAWTHFHWGGPERVTLIANLFSFFPSLAAVAVAWRVAAEKRLPTALLPTMC